MEINQIISFSGHCLHLCNNLNVEEIMFSYLIDADAFVTKDIEFWQKKFEENKIECRIKKPSFVKQKEKIVVDGSSLGKDFKKWEEKWEKNNFTICVYNIDKIDSLILKQLVDVHDKMILSVNKVRMISDKNLEKDIDNLNPEIVEDLIKKELKNIVLSLLLSKPMCGTDLVKVLYSKFKVFISPGMIYPLLHELEKQGFLKYEYKLKNKMYSVCKKEMTETILKNRAEANSLLSQFLLGG